MSSKFFRAAIIADSPERDRWERAEALQAALLLETGRSDDFLASLVRMRRGKAGAHDRGRPSR